MRFGPLQTPLMHLKSGRSAVRPRPWPPQKPQVWPRAGPAVPCCPTSLTAILSTASLCTLAVTYLIGYIKLMDVVLQALADQSRRTVLEILRDHPASAGELADALPIARPGVSRHLRVLREAGLVDVRQEAQRRIYSVRPEPLVDVDEWLGNYRALWANRLDALHTEIARGKKEQ